MDIGEVTGARWVGEGLTSFGVFVVGGFVVGGGGGGGVVVVLWVEIGIAIDGLILLV